jgi:hypothetical protein
LQRLLAQAVNSQTEASLFGAGHALVESLRTRIEEALSFCVAELPGDDRHPFMARRVKNFGMLGLAKNPPPVFSDEPPLTKRHFRA